VGKDADVPAGTRVHAPAVLGIGTRAGHFQETTLPPGTMLENRAWYEEGP
jgi:hypothetical protein